MGNQGRSPMSVEWERVPPAEKGGEPRPRCARAAGRRELRAPRTRQRVREWAAMEQAMEQARTRPRVRQGAGEPKPGGGREEVETIGAAGAGEASIAARDERRGFPLPRPPHLLSTSLPDRRWAWPEERAPARALSRHPPLRRTWSCRPPWRRSQLPRFYGRQGSRPECRDRESPRRRFRLRSARAARSRVPHQ